MGKNKKANKRPSFPTGEALDVRIRGSEAAVESILKAGAGTVLLLAQNPTQML